MRGSMEDKRRRKFNFKEERDRAHCNNERKREYTKIYIQYTTDFLTLLVHASNWYSYYPMHDYCESQPNSF